jgi:hypothetical protein
MRKTLLILPALVSLMALDPAFAQGTRQQRAACERDSHRLCAEAEPDALAVEKCLKAHVGSLSKACQRQVGGHGRH